MAMIILASSSPRRAELLRNAGIPFRVRPAHVPEAPTPGEVPLLYSKRLARDKALAVQRQFPECFVLGADTIVITEEHLLEKPHDQVDAVRMLHLLADRTHTVSTGVCLITPEGKQDVRSETTQVTFGPMTESEIRTYAASGEPLDRAGAYAIQGLASRWVHRIEGCYFNVVGLPVPLVYRMLREHEAI
jgi:septum formation protein